MHTAQGLWMLVSDPWFLLGTSLAAVAWLGARGHPCALLLCQDMMYKGEGQRQCWQAPGHEESVAFVEPQEDGDGSSASPRGREAPGSREERLLPGCWSRRRTGSCSCSSLICTTTAARSWDPCPLYHCLHWRQCYWNSLLKIV